MDSVQERVLTVTNYSYSYEDEEEVEGSGKTRVTIAPHQVEFLIASHEPHHMVNGQEIYKANVVLASGANLELFITPLDLSSIERAIGTYLLPSF